MANINAELAAIMQAVYGQQVRGSIHDAIKKINDVSEVVLTIGTEVDSPTSSTEGFYDGSLYINEETSDLWKCTGSNWKKIGTLRGVPGENGNKWYRGSLVSADNLTADIEASVNDNYLNTSEGKIYHCISGGNPSTWVYDMTLSGGGGGASDWADLDNKPFDTIGSDFKTDDDELALSDRVTEKLTKLSSLEDATESSENYATAYQVKNFANSYTERVSCRFPSGTDNTKGEWQETDPSEWEVDSDHMWILPQLYEKDDEKIELTFWFDTNCNQPIYLGGYQYAPQTVKDGENCGAICFYLANEVLDNDVDVYIDITHVHYDTAYDEDVTIPHENSMVDYGVITSQASRIKCVVGGQSTDVETALNDLNDKINRLLN